MLVGLHWHNRLNQYRRLVRIAVIIAAVSALSTTWLYPTVSPTLSSAVILSCGAGGFFLGLVFEKRRFVSSLKTSPLLGEKLIFVADEELLHVTSPHSRGYLAWTLFHRTVATPDGALLYHQKSSSTGFLRPPSPPKLTTVASSTSSPLKPSTRSFPDSSHARYLQIPRHLDQDLLLGSQYAALPCAVWRACWTD